MADNKQIPWSKIIKLFLEFLLAVVVAIFGTSCVRSVRSGDDIVTSARKVLHIENKVPSNGPFYTERIR